MRSIIALGIAALAGLGSAAPVVANVRFAQKPNSNLVDVTYDLSDPDRDTALSVSVDVSTDGGRTFSVKPRTWTGDVGPGVKPGKGRKITWDMYADKGRFQSDSVVVRVRADDGRQPGGAWLGTTGAGKSLPPGLANRRLNPQGAEEYDCVKDGSVVIRVPALEFWMGSPKTEGERDERPEHQVRLDEFYIDKFEVTNRQYRAFCDSTGHEPPPDPGFPGLADYFKSCPDYPVVNVSWSDAAAYAAWAGKDLPTEAEWEAAARGPSARRFPWGFDAPNGRRANFADRNTDYTWSERAYNDGYARTAPVGSFPEGASPYGAMDMAGNVWEWCEDWYGETYYASSPSHEPQGSRSGTTRVFRGGGWNYGFKQLRCAGRQSLSPPSRAAYLGFRCVRR